MGKEVESPIERLTQEGGEELVEKEGENEAASMLEEKEESTVEDEEEKLVEEEVEDLVEEQGEKVVETPMKNYKKVGTVIIITLCALLIFYFGMTLYFMNHFYANSEINGIDVSKKSVADVEVLMASVIQDYTLNLKERGGKSESIKAADVGLRYNSDEDFKKLKDNQNPFSWALAYFNTQDFKMTVEVTYDEKRFKERIDKLSCLKSNNIIEPKNPSFQYIDSSYVIADEILGNKIDKDVLYSHVSDALLKKEVEIDLELISCYIEPQYSVNSQKIMEVRDTLNKYLSSKITYTFGNSEEVLDDSTLNKWLTVDENFKIAVDEKKVEEYIDMLSEKYNTTGRIRNFVTSSGETIQISGGDFSRPINKVKETQDLIAAIKEGRTIIKEPVYGQNGLSYDNGDIGNTYVEIDLTKQHIWFYKNGSLIVEGDIVTGNVSSGHTTPKGIYELKYKAKNVVLRGPGYAAPVVFWMPFNGGIGMHDANWRSVFGGNIYKTNGSHGCINCSHNVANAIYNNIEQGGPIICY